MVMQAHAWTKKSFQLVEELTPAEQFLALCHDRVQAVVSAVPHPDPAIAKAIEVCDAEVISVSGTHIDKLIADNPFFAPAGIPAGTYQGMDAPLDTFGVKVIAVSSADIDDDTAYQVVKAVFDHLGDIKRLHRSLSNLTPRQMMSDGLSAPLHPGAARYFKENGMM